MSNTNTTRIINNRDSGAGERELSALRLAVQQLSDILFMNILADPTIALPDARVQYAADFLAKLAPASAVIGKMSRMLAMQDGDSVPEECFDSDRMMVRLACREVEAVATVRN